MLCYYITDRTLFAEPEAERRTRLLQTIGRASGAGVDYVLLREDDMAIRELELLAADAVHVIRGEGAARLLIHHRTDVALAVGADGVHLTVTDIAASEARALAAKTRAGHFVVAASCCAAHEVRLAESYGADFVLLVGGLEKLREAAQKDRSPDMRVEAGDTRRRFAVFAPFESVEHAKLCGEAGAMGVAGTRLFQECGDLGELVRMVREL